MRDRLAARGDAWGEFVNLLANYRIDEEDRKKAEKTKHMKPIMPPPNMRKKGEGKEKKK